MRGGFALTLLLGLVGAVPAAVAEEQTNTCAHLEQNGSCLCAIPKEWVPGQVGDLSEIVGNVLVTGAAGYTPPEDGKIPLFSGDNIVVPAQAAALLAFGRYCLKSLPGNSSVLIKTVENCACAVLTEVKPGIPWWPAAAAAGGGIVVLTVIPEEGPCVSPCPGPGSN